MVIYCFHQFMGPISYNTLSRFDASWRRRGLIYITVSVREYAENTQEYARIRGEYARIREWILYARIRENTRIGG